MENMSDWCTLRKETGRSYLHPITFGIIFRTFGDHGDVDTLYWGLPLPVPRAPGAAYRLGHEIESRRTDDSEPDNDDELRALIG